MQVLPSLTFELTGRAEELDLLWTLANERRRAAVIAGDTGVGKTRLAEELVQRLERAGWTSVRVRASHSSSTIPFGAFAAFLANDASSRGVVNQLETFRRIERVVGRIGEGRHVVFVDDAHYLDDASAALVAHLVAGETFVVATLRSGTPGPDAVTALWKEGGAERLDLQPLSQQQTIQLLEAALGGPIEDATAHRVWGWSGGNPLFVRELVLLGRHGHALAEHGGLWCWRGPFSVGGRLIELVSSRLARLPSSVVGLLELLAVGEPLEVALLGPHRQALPLTESAELVVAVVDRGRRLIRFAHPLYGEVLRSCLEPVRSVELYLELAERLEATGARRRGDVMRLATWFLRAGRTPSDPSLLLTASQQALAAGDHGLAIELANAAADVGAGTEAQVAIAEAAYWAGRHGDVLDALGGLDWDLLAPDVAAKAAIVRSSAAFWGLGDAEDAHDVLAAVEERLCGHGLRQEVLAHHASLAFFGGRPAEALRVGREVLTAPSAGPLARLRALPALIGSWAMRGELAEARQAFDAALPDALGHIDELPELAGELGLGRCLAELLAGELDQADAIATTIYDAAVREGSNEFLPTWALFRGRIALARGALGTARRWLREAVAGLEVHDPAALFCWAHALTAMEAALRGAAAVARQGLERLAATRNPAILVYAVEVGAAEAWTIRAEGRLAVSRSTMRDAAEQAQQAGLCLGAAAAWHDLARLGKPEDALGPLSELVPSLEGPLPPTYLAHAAALVELDGAGLDDAAAAFATCGALLLAAEASGAAAVCHAAAGRRGAELASRARCAELTGRCEGAATVPAPHDGAGLARLSDREREVLELAARGLTNREIAAELYLSVRTVGNHLAHVYSKLNLRGRASLASVALLHQRRCANE